MSKSRPREGPGAARPCERCGRREAVASVATVAAVGGVRAPTVTREVCAECAADLDAELRRAPADVRPDFAFRTHPAPRGVLARVRWAWRKWRFERALRRAGG
jgi:hypothetical protein